MSARLPGAGAATAAPADTENTEYDGSAAPQGPRFFFDVFPLHPWPEPLESLTSYLARLAELNGIRTASRMLALCFPGRKAYVGHYKTSGEHADALPIALDALATLAACPPDALRATTFAHLRERFGRRAGFGATHRNFPEPFLAGSLARHLRYCPRCLEERRHYRLPWRFPWLVGCPAHGLRLLDRCGHCARPIQIFATPLRVGACTRCGGDLRRCAAESLGAAAMGEVVRRERDLVALLAPPAGASAEEYVVMVGQRLATARLASRRTVTDVARVLGLEHVAITRIERGQIGRRVTFRAYLACAAYLGVDLAGASVSAPITLAPVPGEGLRPRLLLDMAGVPPAEREAALARVVAVAIDALRAAQVPPTRAAVGEHLGVKWESLKEYPRVRAVFAAESERRRDEREGVVVEQVRRHLASLADGGRGLTQYDLAAACGLPLSTIRQYPAAFALLPRSHAIGERARRGARRRLPDTHVGTVETVPWCESADELRALRDAATDDMSPRRLHALWLVRCGASVREAAARSGVGYSTLGVWLRWYRAGGLDAVVRRIPRRNARRAAYHLDPVLQDTFLEQARAGAFRDYADACAWLWREHGVAGTYHGVYQLLERLGVRLPAQQEDSGSASREETTGTA